MKKNKFKSKKGMTLIEVIISVTLLSILIVPISSVVISALKNSKDGEYRQKASYIGQKVIEELKAYDYIKLDSDRSFKLLDGDKITKDITNDTFVGTFERTVFGAVDEVNRPGEAKFNVEVTMKKNGDFNFDNINNADGINAKYGVVLKNVESVNTVNISGKEADYLLVTGDLVFEANEESLEIYIKSNDSIKKRIEVNKDEKNILIIDVQSGYDKLTNINLINNTKSTLEVHLLKDSDMNNIKINSDKGNVLFTEINRNISNIANMYNYEVVVRDSTGKELFKGSSSSNIIIK